MSSFLEELDKYRYRRIKPDRFTKNKTNKSYNGNNFYYKSNFIDSPTNQKVYVNYHYFQNPGIAIISKLKNYFTKEGKAKDGSEPELFNADGNVRKDDIGVILKEPHVFHVIISPVNGKELDLEEYVKNVMENIERAVSKKLDWTAATHYDKEHPHIHIMIRGKDRNGKNLRFNPEFIMQETRRYCEELATKELGPRSIREINEERMNEITAERYTQTDRKILEKAEKLDNRLFIRPKNTKESTRLEYLVKLNIAKKTHQCAKGSRKLEDNYFEITPDIKERLNALAKYIERMKKMDRFIRGNENKFIYEKSQNIQGTIVYKDLEKELYLTTYAIIKTDENKYYYVSGKVYERFSCGDRIRIKKGEVFKLITKEKKEEYKRSQNNKSYKRYKRTSEN